MLPERVVVAVQLFEPTLYVEASLQVLPLSYDTCTFSPTANTADSVPVMVWLAVLVMKSLLLVPVSADSPAVLTVVVGGAFVFPPILLKAILSSPK